MCEDLRLSLASPGQSFKGINLRSVKSPPAELTPDEVEFLVDTIAGTLDIEAVATKPQMQTHKLKWEILESKHFKRARTAFNRLTSAAQQAAPSLPIADGPSA